MGACTYWMLLVAQLAGGGPSSQHQALAQHEQVPTTAAAAPADTPSEFRQLTTAPIPRAVSALEALRRSPGDAQQLGALVETYSGSGFAGAARFFENALRDLRHEPLLVDPVRTSIAWEATDFDVSGKADEVAKQVASLAARGEYKAAIQAAQASMETDGSSMQVVVQWADTVVLAAIRDPSKISKETLEAAVRIYLTSVLEQVFRPLEVDSPATGFETLSNLFLSLGDHPSSHTAARLALTAVEDRAQPYLGSEAGRREFTAKRLKERIQLLENGGSPR